MTGFVVRRPWRGMLLSECDRFVSERVFRRIQRSRWALCSYSLCDAIVVELRAPSR